MPSKRKRELWDFDPNKSDSEDENFEPNTANPRRARKKSRSSTATNLPRRKRAPGRYRGSDIEDDDDDALTDSDQENSFDGGDDEDEEEAPINEATGRRQRKAAVKRQSYKESSDDDEDVSSVVADSDGKDELAIDGEDDDDGDTSEKQKPKQLIHTFKVDPSRAAKLSTAAKGPVPARRSTRARTTEDVDEFVELSNSGKHALPARGSRSASPEASRRSVRATRGGKGPKKAPPPSTVEEATQENSARGDGAENNDNENVADAMDEDVAQPADADQGADVGADADADEDEHVDTVEQNEEADDDDDGPITRRTRGARTNVAGSAVEEAAAESDSNAASGGRLTRKSRAKKSMQEPSSDFEPGNDSGDENESGSDDKAKSDDDEADEESSPQPRGRMATRGKDRRLKISRQRGESGDEAADIDQNELAEELQELRQSSRAQRRRRRRSPSVIAYEEVSRRRIRKPVDYAIKPLNQLMNEPEEEEDPAPTPARRRGRAGASTTWDRSLHTNAGPFGGVGGAGALFGGPWGTGAAGGVESDSSDDEMGQRSGMAGNVGVTPTSAVAPGLLQPPGQGINLEGIGGLGAAPNVGKIKSQKALADADPLGVDTTTDFTKVGGLGGHIDQLKEMVQLPLLYPDLYQRFHVTPPRGVLFHGPPGTGKTLLARALANAVGIGGKKITFYMRKGADALSKWVGEAEKQLRLLFEEARRTQPSIIFFDEIDGLAPVRSSKQEQIHASIVSTLLALMDGMDGRGQVIVIGATNRPDNIDPALRRPGRFDREFYFPLPDAEARNAILRIHTKDWGLTDDFLEMLGKDTKGYGGADLRALCTEAALNAIQRTYPQIYSSKDKLVVDPDKIMVHMIDFSIAKRGLIPSSERSSTSAAAPIPKAIEPLLRTQYARIKSVSDSMLPHKKKTTALEEAMFEPPGDEDLGFGREALHQELERSRVFRPRLLLTGHQGMGHGYLSAAILHHFEGVHVQSFDLAAMFGESRTAEQVIVSLFTEVKRHKPGIIFIPDIDVWYETMEGPALTVFLALLRSIPPTDPIMVLGTAECESRALRAEIKREIFGFSTKNIVEISRPPKQNREEFFLQVISHLRKFPREFPDPANRKKRVLEELPVAPPPPPKHLTREEMDAERLKYRQLLNLMKVHLQPIMDQINRKYKKFRQAVIPQSQYQYLLDEQDPNYIRPDVDDSHPRPYEIAKDREGSHGIREVATGRFFYNLDSTTIEERLANGYYTNPLEFLKDVRSLVHDARAIGDRERHLKARELLSNVEVDVGDIDQKFRNGGVDWEKMYEEEMQRQNTKLETARKRKAMQPFVNTVQSDTGNGGAGMQNGQEPRGLRTTACFQVMSPLSNGVGDGSSRPLSNGASTLPGAPGEDVQMADADAQTTAEDKNTTPMYPPSHWPRMEQRLLPNSSAQATAGTTTQMSQVSAVQSLPPGVSPSALTNEASTTKTSDPSHRSSNWSTQATNGVHAENSSPSQPLPDTQFPVSGNSQNTTSDEQWPHSQAQGLSRGLIQQSGYSQSSRNNDSSPAARSHQAPSVANLLNDPMEENSQLQSQQTKQNSGPSASQLVELDESSAHFFLEELTNRTSECTVEQLEQINRDLMAEIWNTRGEGNRMKALNSVTRVFNQSIDDIELMQSKQQ